MSAGNPRVRELVVVSGKGGTGKTSLVASLAALWRSKVVCDCDVDAADLYLVLAPEVREEHAFSGGSTARLDPAACVQCGRCLDLCRFDAIVADPGKGRPASIDEFACEGCGLCSEICPADAITLEPTENGRWYVSDTRHGPLVHARLGPAEENSGKLVTLVRGEARRVAKELGVDVILVDGSPGIGCPVIASITGATQLLVVTEPSASGIHDLERVLELAERLSVPAAVIVNRWDVHPEGADAIQRMCEGRGVEFLAKIPYDPDVTRAQVAGVPVVEYREGAAAQAMRDIAASAWALLEGRARS
jgi:MinD superfamily P-loop ATPase